MKSFRLQAAVLALVPLSLNGADLVPPPPIDSNPSTEVSGGAEWLDEIDFSPEQLDADYERAIGNEAAGAPEVSITDLVKKVLGRREVMIPIFLAAADQAGEPAKDAANDIAPAGGNAALEARLLKLERENALLTRRLAQLEPSIEPVGPFVDPDWPPAKLKPKKKFRFRTRGVQRIKPASPRRPIVAVERPSARFRPFTRAAMNTEMSGRTSRARAQSLKEQRQFFHNATKALGAGVASKEYRGVRLEVENAMLRGELRARYAAQYLADVVDIFRTYERMQRFGLTDRIAPPVSADTFRRDPEYMFIWASEVTEQKRKLNRENSLSR